MDQENIEHLQFKYLVNSFDCNEENFELLKKELIRFHKLLQDDFKATAAECGIDVEEDES